MPRDLSLNNKHSLVSPQNWAALHLKLLIMLHVLAQSFVELILGTVASAVVIDTRPIVKM